MEINKSYVLCLIDWPTKVMAQSPVAVSLLTTVTIKFHTTLVLCALAASQLDQSCRDPAAIPCWKSVQDLTNQEQAFINHPQPCCEYSKYTFR